MTARFWFSFDASYMHFTMMSTEHPYEPGSEQYEWMRQDMAKARSNPNTPWLVVTGHRPMVMWQSRRLG